MQNTTTHILGIQLFRENNQKAKFVFCSGGVCGGGVAVLLLWSGVVLVWNENASNVQTTILRRTSDVFLFTLSIGHALLSLSVNVRNFGTSTQFPVSIHRRMHEVILCFYDTNESTLREYNSAAANALNTHTHIQMPRRPV